MQEVPLVQLESLYVVLSTHSHPILHMASVALCLLSLQGTLGKDGAPGFPGAPGDPVSQSLINHYRHDLLLSQHS